MSDGNTVFEAIDAWKLRHQQSEFDAHISVIAEDAKLCIAGNAMTSTCGEIGETSDPRTGDITTQVSNRLSTSRAWVGLCPHLRWPIMSKLDRPGIVSLPHSPTRRRSPATTPPLPKPTSPLLDDWLPPPSRFRKTTVIELTDPNANPVSKRLRAVHAVASVPVRDPRALAHAGAGCRPLFVTSSLDRGRTATLSPGCQHRTPLRTKDRPAVSRTSICLHW